MPSLNNAICVSITSAPAFTTATTWFEFHAASSAKPWEGHCSGLLQGTELKSPLCIIWGRNGQINFRTILMRSAPSLSLKTDEWINACMHPNTHAHTHTHKYTVNLPGHINRAGVLSNAPSRTWISASQTEGTEGGGKGRERAKGRLEEKRRERAEVCLCVRSLVRVRHQTGGGPRPCALMTHQ